MAHLGVARANALQARTSQSGDADASRVRSLAAYKNFLVLWKDAEPDILILKHDQAGYAKLQQLSMTRNSHSEVRPLSKYGNIVPGAFTPVLAKHSKSSSFGSLHFICAWSSKGTDSDQGLSAWSQKDLRDLLSKREWLAIPTGIGSASRPVKEDLGTKTLRPEESPSCTHAIGTCAC